MDKLKYIHHISDIQIRNLKRHKEYNEVFERTYKEIEKYKDDFHLSHLECPFLSALILLLNKYIQIHHSLHLQSPTSSSIELRICHPHLSYQSVLLLSRLIWNPI